MNGRLKYLFAAISTGFIWGVISIPLRKLHDFDSEEILYYRIFVSLIVSWLTIFSFKRKSLKKDIQYFSEASSPTKRKLIILTVLAGALITGNWFTFIYAVNHVSLTSAAFAYMVCPLLTSIGGFVILKENVSRLKIYSICIALMSILMLVRGSLIDVIWSVVIALCYAFYLIIQKTIPQVDKLTVLAVQLAVSTILMLPFFITHFNGFRTETFFWLYIVLISVFFTIIPLMLSLYALAGLPSSTVGITIYVNPIIAFLVAFIYFDEKVTVYQCVAYALLLLSILIFNWEIIRNIINKNFSETPCYGK